MNCEGQTKYYCSSRIRGNKWQRRPCKALHGIKRITVVIDGKTKVDKWLCPTHRRAVRESWRVVVRAKITEH